MLKQSASYLNWKEAKATFYMVKFDIAISVLNDEIFFLSFPIADIFQSRHMAASSLKFAFDTNG